jgi:hypothetical protein
LRQFYDVLFLGHQPLLFLGGTLSQSFLSVNFFVVEY